MRYATICNTEIKVVALPKVKHFKKITASQNIDAVDAYKINYLSLVPATDFSHALILLIMRLFHVVIPNMAFKFGANNFKPKS